MADVFTQVTSESWFSRLGNAFKGILFGLILFFGSFVLLFWNEGRAVSRYKTLKEGEEKTIPVSSESVDPVNLGKLIHVTGKAVTNETLADSIFNVSAKALKLKRVVEMYQWNEKKTHVTKKKLGGGTETVETHTYNKEWSSKLISSERFHYPADHQNPPSMQWTSSEWCANEITLGAFRLSRSLIDRIHNYTPMPIDGGTIPEILKGKAKVFMGGYYIGISPNSTPDTPQIGDMRINFNIVNPTDLSIVAKQSGNTFEPYITEVGGTIELLETGIHSKQEMYKDAQRENTIITWLLRVLGFILMSLGIAMVFKPLSVFGDLLPILGDILGAGVGIISFLLALVLSLLTISIAWLFYRPLLGLTLIAVAVGVLFIIKGKAKKPAQKDTKDKPAEGMVI